MNFIQVLIVVGAVFAGFAAAQTPYKDCGSELGTITRLNISGCTADNCIVKKGTNMSIDLEFKANKDTSEATASVHIYLLGVTFLYPLPDPNACHFMTCPVKSGTVAYYKTNLFIQKQMQSAVIHLTWELKNSKGNITCFMVPMKLQSSNPSRTSQ